MNKTLDSHGVQPHHVFSSNQTRSKLHNTQISSSSTGAPKAPTTSFELSTSRQFNSWLHEQQISLAFSTYQAGKIFYVGLKDKERLSVFERTHQRCMGLWSNGRSLYLSTLYQLIRFENALALGQCKNGYDCLHVPQMSYFTGDLDIHDMVVATLPTQIEDCGLTSTAQQPLQSEAGIIFVNTLFGCLATVSATDSFIPLWKPPFISRLAAEDRCHLNGVAVRDRQVRYVTATSQSDVAEGWRDHREDGGCVIDIATNEIIATGLSMPHSPRWYRDRLWVLDSGRGNFGYVDIDTGEFIPITFCPGYARGLSFVDHYALVGLSKPRGNQTFAGLALDEKLKRKNAEPRCGILVIDLNTGDIVHSLRLEGIVREMYDVTVLPNIHRPMAIGFQSDEIRRVVTIGE